MVALRKTATMFQIILVLFVTLFKLSHSFSDIGKWDLSLNGDFCEFTLAKSLFKDSELSIMLKCEVKSETNFTVSYWWEKTICSPDYLHYFEQQVVMCTNGQTVSMDSNATSIGIQQVENMPYSCPNNKQIVFIEPLKTETTQKDDANAVVASKKKDNTILTVDREGIYVLRMRVKSKEPLKATVKVEMKSPYGYLSAAIWPLLPFFGVMCAIYTVLCTGWLAVCWFQWRDLLRIQYWIGAVALLGMLESATYYGVYSTINNTGYFSTEVYIFAEWISVAKRALARMLVIIVSLGFGIVKPRLGPALQRVVGTGLLWGALCGINAWLKLQHSTQSSNRELLLSEVPLSLLDSAICWWVFVSLAHTMRTLQLRRNTIKLSLYKHFTNTLVFAVISSVVFMLYSIKSYRVLQCITEWKEVWLDEAYWHVLFCCVLTVIMVLWRPTNNNQRYAFTPLLDNAEDDDEEEEQFVNDAYGVKMRGTGAGEEPREPRPEPHAHNSLDSDLRWVEENIPTSTLPLLDSDEEIINTKFEVSKMQ